MPTVIATVGASNANSFVTVAEGDTYCDARLNASAWTDAEDDDKAKAVIEATRELSAKMWVGSKSTTAQALAWPRAYATDPDAAWAGWGYYDSNIVPQRVKDATCELALQFLIGGTTDVASLDPTLNVRRKVVDVLETEYFEPQQRRQGLSRFPSVLRFVQPLLIGQGSSVPLVRG